jgi:B-block binding subunit of TFIIIC
MMGHTTEDPTWKIFRIIVNNGKEGILQSSLWKQFEMTSRNGSRLAIKLEKQSLIKRERILEKGRWTYKLLPIEIPVDAECIDKAPCLTCPVEHMCFVDSNYSPNNCNLIQDWLLSSIDTSSLLPYSAELHEENIETAEVSVSQPKSSAKRHPKRATKNNKK